MLVSGRFPELEAALVERVRELRAGRPLVPLTVVVGSSAVRTRVGDVLVRGLGAIANVSVLTLAQLARRLATEARGAPPLQLAGLARERLLRRLVTEQAGRGFAVVADEVRNLAQRCAQAAKETAGKIEGAISKTEQGVQISAKVARGLQDIVSKIRQVDALVAEVAAASKEQSQGIEQVNTAVSQMDTVTQSNAANAEESAAAAEELNVQAQSMNEAVASLQQLVGASGRAITSPALTSQPRVEQTAPPPAGAFHRRAPEAPANRRCQPASKLGGKNGRLLTPVAALASAGLPMPPEGDFKDF